MPLTVPGPFTLYDLVDRAPGKGIGSGLVLGLVVNQMRVRVRLVILVIGHRLLASNRWIAEPIALDAKNMSQAFCQCQASQWSLASLAPAEHLI